MKKLLIILLIVPVLGFGQTGSQTGYYFHGGNQSYPFVQASGGLTDPDVGILYYNDGINEFQSTTDLSVAMSYIMDNMGS